MTRQRGMTSDESNAYWERVRTVLRAMGWWWDGPTLTNSRRVSRGWISPDGKRNGGVWAAPATDDMVAWLASQGPTMLVASPESYTVTTAAAQATVRVTRSSVYDALLDTCHELVSGGQL
jgi:hypothetical protein